LRVAADGVAGDIDGWTTVTVPIEQDDVATRQFIQFGADLEVLSPPSLRQRLQQRASELVRLYSSGGAGGGHQ
jgi:predicted DNA-binding transcriptional regulator YafY